jgi:phospholipid/cholesterol/gamma-HCH transport system ATP-binding protein
LLLTSEDPVVAQFLNGRREGPIGMSEEKDAEEQRAEAKGQAAFELPPMKPQLTPMDGGPRAAVTRRLDRVMQTLHELPPKTQQAIRASLSPEERRKYGVTDDRRRDYAQQQHDPEAWKQGRGGAGF